MESLRVEREYQHESTFSAPRAARAAQGQCAWRFAVPVLHLDERHEAMWCTCLTKPGVQRCTVHCIKPLPKLRNEGDETDTDAAKSQSYFILQRKADTNKQRQGATRRRGEKVCSFTASPSPFSPPSPTSQTASAPPHACGFSLRHIFSSLCNGDRRVRMRFGRASKKDEAVVVPRCGAPLPPLVVPSSPFATSENPTRATMPTISLDSSHTQVLGKSHAACPRTLGTQLGLHRVHIASMHRAVLPPAQAAAARLFRAAPRGRP